MTTTGETKPVKPRKDKPRLIKFKTSEVEVIQSKADVYTKGNFSEFVRLAATEYEPTSEPKC